MGHPAAQNWFSFWSGEPSIVFLLSGGRRGCFWEVFGVTFAHLEISFVDDFDKVFVFVRRANVADMDAVIELWSTHILPSPFPRFHIMSICLSLLVVVFVLGVSQFRPFRLLAGLSNCLRVRACACACVIDTMQACEVPLSLQGSCHQLLLMLRSYLK